jgi:hypothetical protein
VKDFFVSTAAAAIITRVFTESVNDVSDNLICCVTQLLKLEVSRVLIVVSEAKYTPVPISPLNV